MIALDAGNVRLGESPASKEEAIRMVASLLADGGHIDPGYAESMLGREKVANTYLGEGIAIPHGLLKDREMIRRPGSPSSRRRTASSGTPARTCASWSGSPRRPTSTCRSSRT